jgi:hypothetical protein
MCRWKDSRTCDACGRLVKSWPKLAKDETRLETLRPTCSCILIVDALMSNFDHGDVEVVVARAPGNTRRVSRAR